MPKCPVCGITLDLTLHRALSGDDIHAMLQAINDSDLDGDAGKFVADLKSRLARYGDRTKITQPQRRWLAELAKKYPVRMPDTSQEES